MAATQRVRFLILSDTHDMILSDDSSNALRHPAPETDVVLHCGDLSGDTCSASSLHAALKLLSSIPAELRLVIAGNHDTALDPEFHTFQGGRAEDHHSAMEMMTGKIAKELGVTYLHEGTHRFTLKSGATFSIYASPYTPSQYGSQYNLHAFQHASNEDRYNPRTTSTGSIIMPSHAKNASTARSTIPDFPSIDIVMTHGPPKYLLDRSGDGSSAGCEHLRRAICRAKPRLHCFGHIHAAYGAHTVAWRNNLGEEELQGLGIDVESMSKDDDMVPLPNVEPEGLLRNSNRRRGYAEVKESTTNSLVHGSQTLMVNAAIMDHTSQPTNAPWLVRLDLPMVLEIPSELPGAQFKMEKRKRIDDEQGSAKRGRAI